jgi:predicted RNA-binding Zn-ribbon protein involved in translation (DUF1610 family)
VVITVLAYLVFILLAVGAVLVLVGTVVKNRWGINVEPLRCPNCGDLLGRVRIPKNLSQTLWGGNTCDKCGVEVDKWGRPVTQPSSPKLAR